jgi:hypothetical protein
MFHTISSTRPGTALVDGIINWTSTVLVVSRGTAMTLGYSAPVSPPPAIWSEAPWRSGNGIFIIAFICGSR